MDPIALAFLVVGVVGLVVLGISLVFGEVVHLASVDADGPFSLPAIAALVGGTGFGGAATVSLLPGLPTAATVALAVAGGLVVALPLAWGTVRLTAALQHMPTQATLTRAHLLGALGVVVSGVPTDGLGEVRLNVAGQQLKYYARSDIPLPAGTPVYVVDTPTETSVQVVSTADHNPGGPIT